MKTTINWLRKITGITTTPKADKVLTYEEYRKTIQLSNMTAKVRANRPAPAPQKTITPVQSNKIIDPVLYNLTDGKYGVLNIEGEEEAGNLILA